MPRIEYVWQLTDPPATGVYPTRRDESKYLTNRYWDGEAWFEIAYSDSRGGEPFKWPRKSFVREPKPAKWEERDRYEFYRRRIHKGQETIQWGIPRKVYSPDEVLKYLVHRGDLPANWKTTLQDDMRRDNW